MALPGRTWSRAACGICDQIVEHSFPLTFRHSHIQSWLSVKQKQMKVLCHLKAAKIFLYKNKNKKRKRTNVLRSSDHKGSFRFSLISIGIQATYDIVVVKNVFIRHGGSCSRFRVPKVGILHLERGSSEDLHIKGIA